MDIEYQSGFYSLGGRVPSGDILLRTVEGREQSTGYLVFGRTGRLGSSSSTFAPPTVLSA